MSSGVLFVCTGNVCRSPMAELLLRAAVDEPDLQIRSAGMYALVGDPMDSGSAAALRDLGIDPSAHRARQFEPWMAAAADLVLTAERVHRHDIMTAVPTAFRRVFTLREFARLAQPVPGGDLREVVARAAAMRGMHGEVDARADDISDPYRAGKPVSAAVAAQIAAVVDVLIDTLDLRRRRAAEGHPPAGIDRPA